MAIIEPLGDCGVIVQFGQEATIKVQEQVTAFSRLLQVKVIEGFIEYIPAYTTVAIFYDPMYFQNHTQRNPYENCKRLVETLITESERQQTSRDLKLAITIPVCYGGRFGPDLAKVANYHRLTEAEVIQIHSEAIYTVAMIGFSPGFPYLSGLNEKIETPRLESPRKMVPKGSVGIAGGQTGVYTQDSPGGWQIIGQTPLSLFDVTKIPPSLLQQGNTVRFHPISKEDWSKLGGMD